MMGPPALPFARLVLLDDPQPRTAAMNMAVDEMLLTGLAGQPLLRIYRWTRPSVSIGCFDPVEPAMQRWPTHDLVRRWTGGGMVEHGSDLTFSLLVPRSQPLALLPASESYRVIHEAVAGALSRTGIAAGTLDPPSKSVPGGSRACFENPVAFDLLVADRKVAGGAQRRTKSGLLHQGSVQNNQLAAAALTALANALPQVFGQNLEGRALSPAELDLASTLAAEKYGSEAWLRRFLS